MEKSSKFVLKLIAIIAGIFALIFLFQAGRYYYKIKTGAVIPNFTTAKEKPATESALNSQEILNAKAPYFGAVEPELTIVEFASFSCPYSKKASSATRELMLKYKDRVKYIYREFPIDELYADSSTLALVSKCANAQNKFWLVHDKIYNASNIESATLIKQAGLNEAAFQTCINNQTYLNDVQQDLSDGLKNGVRGTPTFFFIKKDHEDSPIKVEGAIPKNTFEQIIEKLLK